MRWIPPIEPFLPLLRLNLLVIDLGDLGGAGTHVEVLHELVDGACVALGFTDNLRSLLVFMVI